MNLRRLAVGASLLATLPLPIALHAQQAATEARLTSSGPLELDPLVVSTSRMPAPPRDVPFALTALTGSQLGSSPASTVDGALRAVPGFSLFRRSDSFSANPTAQGVSLRGLGPSGASRSLVLLDGVPLNDPFGGWVAWSKVPRESLASVEIVRGGGATAWGNAALGGIVQLLTARDPDNRIAASYGEFDTHSVELTVSQPVGRGALQLFARDFSTDGFSLVAPEDRGPIDQPAASEHRWFSGRWRQTVGNVEITATARTYREERNNGTPYQRNLSDENFGSVAMAGGGREQFRWEFVAYGQEQSFASTFSSVNATRSAETPASDQYDVPATTFGGSWTGSWHHGNDARTSGGLDYRHVRGETREYFTFSAGSFTRQRIAGGAQDIGGVFALHDRRLADNVRGTVGVRLDSWRERDGHRRETDRATGATLRDDRYADRDDLEFSPSAGVVWTVAPAWSVRVAGQHAFRRPTLNELYRPFRVGNVITEANPALATEHVASAELGLKHTRNRLTVEAAVFRSELRDAVGNVTLARGPGTFPIVGFVPAGGLGRQRLNLDEARVQGLELSARWEAARNFTLTADYLYNDATVRFAAAAPALAGKRLAQVPRHSASFGAAWRPRPKLSLTPRARWLGRQFEDDENLLPLSAALVVDLGISYELSTTCTFFINVENLTDERIETGRSADGLFNTGTPRLASAGLRAHW